jgi:hypothetical protein
MRSIDYPRGVACCHVGSADLAHRMREFARARALTMERLAIDESLGNRAGIAHASMYLGIFAFGEGDLQQAQVRIAHSYAIWRDLGLATIWHDIWLGYISATCGDAPQATALLDGCRRWAIDRGDRRSEVCAVEGYAHLALSRGETLRAARIAGAAVASCAREGLTDNYWDWPQEPWRRERLLAELRSTLGDAPFHEAFVEGQALTLEQAADEALAWAATRDV